MNLKEVAIYTLKLIQHPVSIPELTTIIWKNHNNGRELEFYDSLYRTFEQGHVKEPKAELQNRIYAQNKHWHEVFVDKTIRPQLIALSDTNSVSKSFYLSFSIDFTNIENFIRHWSGKYNYQWENKYDDNINKPLTESSIMELFEWKNGSVLSTLKKQSVKENYPSNFLGNKEDRYLNPNQSGGAIWNIFYLHCLEPNKYPIFDQHTLRAMKYIQTNEIIDTDAINDTNKYQIYKNEYIPFINSFSNIDNRTLDKALFAFGQFLKKVMQYV